MYLQPIKFRDAVAFIEENHRHHNPPRGCCFALAACVDDRIVGVCTVGRPVARGFDDGGTLEVTRCCTDGTKNACSFLYSKARRAATALGYERLITYTMESEQGSSLRGAGWKQVQKLRGRSWSCPSRPRVDLHPLQDKIRWEAVG